MNACFFLFSFFFSSQSIFFKSRLIVFLHGICSTLVVNKNVHAFIIDDNDDNDDYLCLLRYNWSKNDLIE